MDLFGNKKRHIKKYYEKLIKSYSDYGLLDSNEPVLGFSMIYLKDRKKTKFENTYHGVVLTNNYLFWAHNRLDLTEIKKRYLNRNGFPYRKDYGALEEVELVYKYKEIHKFEDGGLPSDLCVCGCLDPLQVQTWGPEDASTSRFILETLFVRALEAVCEKY